MIIMPIAFAVFGFIFAFLGMKTSNKIVVVFGIVFVLSAVFLFYQFFKERRLRKLYEQDPEAYEAQFEDEENEEQEKYYEELEECEQFDSDSGKGYCPYCGNYAVTANKCESCGEEVTE